MSTTGVSHTFSCSDLKGVIGIAGFVLQVIQYVGPILLILWGSFDLIRAIIAGKEEEVKKKQKTLISRAIAAVLLFLVPFLVQIILGLVGSEKWQSCWKQYRSYGIFQVDDDWSDTGTGGTGA